MQHAQRLGLVLLHADGALRDVEHLHDAPDAGEDGQGMLLHDAVIGGDIGLALGGIDEEMVDLLLGVELDVGGQSRAAHADRAGAAQCGQKARAVRVGRHGDVREWSLLSVRRDLHGLADIAVRQTVVRDGSDGAGDTGVDVGGEGCLTGADRLPDRDGLAELDGRRTGRAHVHRHGDQDLLRHRERREGLGSGILGVREPHAAELAHRVPPLGAIRQKSPILPA